MSFGVVVCAKTVKDAVSKINAIVDLESLVIDSPSEFFRHVLQVR
jgi:hypothetical protein